MARPRTDLRQKTLIPTVFSNVRIGKLGKSRPWIFQTWAGLLSRSDAYGIFKWEPERIAILVWPYNTTRSGRRHLRRTWSCWQRVVRKTASSRSTRATVSGMAVSLILKITTP